MRSYIICFDCVARFSTTAVGHDRTTKYLRSSGYDKQTLLTHNMGWIVDIYRISKFLNKLHRIEINTLASKSICLGLREVYCRLSVAAKRLPHFICSFICVPNFSFLICSHSFFLLFYFDPVVFFIAISFRLAFFVSL